MLEAAVREIRRRVEAGEKPLAVGQSYGLTSGQVRKVLAFDPASAPPCCPDPWDFLGWLMYRIEKDAGAIELCHDCTPAYQEKQIALGRCRRPDVRFAWVPRENGHVGEFVPHELVGLVKDSYREGCVPCIDTSPDLPCYLWLRRRPVGANA